MYSQYALGLCLLAASLASAASADDEQINLGRQIYLHGQTSEGKPLQAKRADMLLKGAEAACVQCHRPSGLGGSEGKELVPPITGKALFESGEPVLVEVRNGASRGLSKPSPRYDGKAFAAALRDGKQVSGRTLQTLMPRYQLTDKELQALAAYLGTLSSQWSPGVSADEIHLATVITPEVGTERRKAFIDTLNALLNQHNVNVHAKGHHKVPMIERRLHSQRTWSLDVWELAGPSSTWAVQLETRQRQNPAFAIVSGLSDGEWQPVQAFCESKRVACWFPSIDAVPADAANAQYSLYFSAGVSLEAEVIANRLRQDSKASGKVVQVVGPGFVEQSAAAALSKLLGEAKQPLLTLNWQQDTSDSLRGALQGLQSNDTLVLWLRDAQLHQVLSEIQPPPSPVYLSATLNGDNPKLEPVWLDKARLVQRFERPKLRSANLKRFHDWINFRKLNLVDDKVQSELFFAVNSLDWMLSSMLNNLYSDYLIERAEATLSMRDAMQVQEEVQSMMMGGGGHRPVPLAAAQSTPLQPHVADINFLRQRESTTLYPRLGLGIGQRFASKGAFVHELRTAIGSGGEQAGDWVIP